MDLFNFFVYNQQQNDGTHSEHVGIISMFILQLPPVVLLMTLMVLH